MELIVFEKPNSIKAEEKLGARKRHVVDKDKSGFVTCESLFRELIGNPVGHISEMS